VADHDDLRRMLADAPAAGSIDVDGVIARARRRRLPRRIAAGSVSALAVVGVVVLGAQALQPPAPTSTVMLEQQRDVPAQAPPESSDSAFIGIAPAEKVNGCQGTVAEVAAGRSGLEVVLVLQPSVAPGATLRGEAVLTNSGQTAVQGTASAPPAVTVARAGTVVWHSSGLQLQPVRVQLEPGESVRLPIELTAVECAPEHDGLERFPDDLPPLPAGDYAVTALLDFAEDDGLIELVTGPATAITVP
jgi:hypothetical protein